MELIIEIIVLFLCIYPGAFFRWLFIGKKKTFKEIANEDGYMNGTIGALFIALIIVLVKIIAF